LENFRLSFIEIELKYEESESEKEAEFDEESLSLQKLLFELLESRLELSWLSL